MNTRLIIFRRLLDKIRRYLNFERRRLNRQFSKFQKRFYNKLWRDAAEDIGAEIDDYGYGFLRIRKGDKSTFVRGFEVMLDDHLTLNIAGNKPLALKICKEYGYPTPDYLEYDLGSISRAREFLERLGKMAVVKPAYGTGAGRGVTTRIDSYKKLKQASYLAAAFKPQLLIEEQVSGDSFRLLYINGAFVDAIRRDPPVVVGDGQSSIKELIRKENEKRLDGKEMLTFHPLVIDFECRLKLKGQGLDPGSIPESGARVVVKEVINENSCFENHVVRDVVHSSIIELGSNILRQFNIKLGGIDIITPDVSRPLEESGGVINEINTTPGLHHHYLVSEKEQRVPVGKMVLEYIFSNQQ